MLAVAEMKRKEKRVFMFFYLSIYLYCLASSLSPSNHSRSRQALLIIGAIMAHKSQHLPWFARTHKTLFRLRECVCLCLCVCTCVSLFGMFGKCMECASLSVEVEYRVSEAECCCYLAIGSVDQYYLYYAALCVRCWSAGSLAHLMRCKQFAVVCAS